MPVWLKGGLLFTGDSHALQGDGEVNITALETAMEEVQIQVILHKRASYAWPMIETPTHWLMLGMHESLNEALRISLRSTIDFLASKAKLSRADAYGLASLAVDFRVSQMVDVNNGIHAMIPKAIFAPDFPQNNVHRLATTRSGDGRLVAAPVDQPLVGDHEEHVEQIADHAGDDDR